MQKRDHGLEQGKNDQVDLLLANLHRLQRPDKFTPLAEACGWVKKEVPSGLVEGIILRIQREERRRRCRRLCLSGSLTCLLHVYIFIAADRVMNATETGKYAPGLVGSFWLLASLLVGFLLPVWFFLAYVVRQEGKVQSGFTASARNFPYALSRKSS
ncbi:MAG TPA: hypothetical protein GXX33_02230 [Firmicutes bacterium]|uniref:Uncharacterized protein n=1 Tax=Capillibacterium thermochitinicola TaxID=2699427 RepID=A0A8J6I0P7_9FIRM|nr:hypothetical protein [Capillibacterium thermochitinicola]MBA2133123.1 hypothetical protein [Capillibacterium thermochitinicola]HHW11814.1 hypothetical protein [Bacillota bacterium]